MQRTIHAKKCNALGRVRSSFGSFSGLVGASWESLGEPVGSLGSCWKPRWSQEALKKPQKAPNRPQEVPKRSPRASKRRPRATQEAPKKPPRPWKSRKNRIQNTLLFRTSFRNDFLANFHRFLVYFGIQKHVFFCEICGRQRKRSDIVFHGGAPSDVCAFGIIVRREPSAAVSHAG